MTAVSSHEYSARVVDAGGDIVLSLAEENAGSITLDAARIPHVSGRITCALPSGRVEHVPATYTPWVEQRRNTIPNPSLQTWTGWSVPSVHTVSPGGIVDIAATSGMSALLPYQTNVAAAAPGEVWSESLDVTVPVGYPAVRMNLAVVPYASASSAVGPFAYSETVTVQPGTTHTFKVTHPGLPATAIGIRLIPYLQEAAKAGRRVIMARALQEKAPAPGPYFNGATNPNGNLDRTRWLGAANASASVVEAREVDVPAHEVWVPEDVSALLEALDPRDSRRVVLEVDASTPAGARFRSFDLGIRERPVLHADGTVELTLASDEALLDDYRPLVDDLTPLAHQGSLRAIVNYVLGKAIPGAALEASPAHDADMTTTSDAENVFRDPRAWNTFVGGGCTVAQDAVWPGAIEGVPHKSIWMHTPTSPDSYAYLLGPGSMNGMNPGETWVLSATGRVHLAQGGTFDPRARRLVVFIDVGGYVTVQSAAVPAAVGSTARVSVEFTIPTGAREVFARAYHGATSGEVKWSQIRLSRKSTQPGVDDTVYFWGGKPDTAAYDYSWVGDADLSASKRRAVIDRKPEILVWRAGQSAIDFLHPLVQVHGLRLVCDEQRRWTLRDENYTAPGSLSIRYGVNLLAGRDKISRDDDTWCDAAIVRYRWTDYTGVQQERVDAFAAPGATRAVEIIKSTPWPGVGFAEYFVRRSMQRGREVSLTTVSDWDTRAEQLISAVLPGAPVQVGTTQSVTFDLGNDQMTVLTRSSDTPPAAWVLIPAGESWLDSPVGESWIEETP